MQLRQPREKSSGPSNTIYVRPSCTNMMLSSEDTPSFR